MADTVKFKLIGRNAREGAEGYELVGKAWATIGNDDLSASFVIDITEEQADVSSDENDPAPYVETTMLLTDEERSQAVVDAMMTFYAEHEFAAIDFLIGSN